MRRLNVLLLRSYLLPLVMVFAISVFILLMQFIWKYIDDLVGKGLDMTIIMELLTYATAYVIPNALPLSILIASLMAFGNLGEHHELLALKSSGISLLQIMKPLIFASAFISITAFSYSNYVLPVTNLKLGTLLWDIRNQRPELNLKAGTFNNDIEGYTIKVGEKNYNTNLMYNFMIYDHTDYNGNRTITAADSAKMKTTEDEKYLILELFNGTRYEELKSSSERGKNALNRYNFEKQKIVLDLSGFEFKRTDVELFRQDYRGKNLIELRCAIDSLNKVMKEKKQNFTKSFIHSKIASGDRKIYYYPDTIVKVPDLDTLKADSFVDPDSIFDAMDNKQKMRVTALALNRAQNAQRRVSDSQREFYHHGTFLNKHKAEWHNKLTLAFACFVFFFIGAPLGAIIRKGGLAVPIVVSALIFIVYYMISLVSKKLVVESLMPAAPGMWMASFIIFIFGLFLTYKASRDSVILNIDIYIEKLKKLTRF